MSLIVKPTYEPRTNPEIRLVPTTSQGPGPKKKYVELHVTNDGKTAVVKLNSLEADTLAQGLRTATR